MQALGFTAPIYLAKPMSGLCRFWANILHAFAGAVFIGLSFPAYAKTLLVLTLLVSFWSTYRSYRKTDLDLLSAQLRDDDRWLLVARTGEIILADATRESFVTPNLMILTLREASGRVWMLSIARDNASPDVMRRLFVRLRYSPG